MSLLIEELSKENLCTHFILPLLRINRFSFVSSNFFNSWLTRDMKLVVAVIDIEFVPGIILALAHKTPVYKDGYWYIVFDVHRVWVKDVEMFRLGKFSEMSADAKDKIRKFSGLPYREFNERGDVVTDLRLLALDKSEALRETWERDLDCDPLGNMELLDIPGDCSYIDLEGLL